MGIDVGWRILKNNGCVEFNGLIRSIPRIRRYLAIAVEQVRYRSSVSHDARPGIYRKAREEREGNSSFVAIIEA